MRPRADRIRKALAVAVEGEMVPFVSLWLVIAAVVLGGFDYAVMVEGARLTFYAVLVAIWTSLAPTEPLEEGGTYAQFEFLMICIGAIVVGFGVEWLLTQLSGRLYAVQALALIVVSTRLYVNSLDGASLERTLRWQDPTHRYLVYTPALTALALPVVLHQLGVEALFDTPLETPEGLLVVAGLGLLLGLTLYAALDWLPEVTRARPRRREL